LVAFVQPVVGPTREDVLVKVPDVLPAGRFVVLARGDAIAGVGGLHSDRDALGDGNEVDAEPRWELVEVLEVRVRDHENVARIPWPPVTRDERGHGWTLDDHRGPRGPLGLTAPSDVTERALPPFRGVAH
jgi:hypothetical protein